MCRRERAFPLASTSSHPLASTSLGQKGPNDAGRLDETRKNVSDRAAMPTCNEVIENRSLRDYRDSESQLQQHMRLVCLQNPHNFIFLQLFPPPDKREGHG